MKHRLASADGQTIDYSITMSDMLLVAEVPYQRHAPAAGILASEGGPPLAAFWWTYLLDAFVRDINRDRKLLAFRYGCDDDFGGGMSVVIDGRTWALDFGPGICLLTRSVYRSSMPEGMIASNSRSVAWNDLRGETELQTDDGTIQLQRRAWTCRWCIELPRVMSFLSKLPKESEVSVIR